MDIQWYPGHMAKARRILEDSLKQIDVVIEIADARAPRSTRNPDFEALFRTKQRILLLNKADLAAPAGTAAWTESFRAEGIPALGVVSTSGKCREEVLALIRKAAEPKVEAMLRRGIHKTVRCMIVGIPNVGKSTLINRVAGSTRAKVGNKPGVTKSQQWVRVTDYLELLDTPGLLWPKLSDQETALNLAWIGSIRDEIMDREALAAGLIRRLTALDPERIRTIFPDLPETGTDPELLAAVAKNRNLLLKGGEPDRERAADHALHQFRDGAFGRFTLELPGGEQDADT